VKYEDPASNSYFNSSVLSWFIFSDKLNPTNHFKRQAYPHLHPNICIYVPIVAFQNLTKNSTLIRKPDSQILQTAVEQDINQW